MVIKNSRSLHDLCGLINERPFSGIRLSGIEAAISICDMGKSEIECDDIMRCCEKIIYQHLSVSIALNLGTAHYHKGKESDSVFLMS